MTELVYRGVVSDTEQLKAEAEKAQATRPAEDKPHLVYRGTEHDGTHNAEDAGSGEDKSKLIYRGCSVK